MYVYICTSGTVSYKLPLLYHPHTPVNDNTTQCSPSSFLYLLVPQAPVLHKIRILS